MGLSTVTMVTKSFLLPVGKMLKQCAHVLQCVMFFFNYKRNIRLMESKHHIEGGTNESHPSVQVCNRRRGLPNRGCCKSWTRGWDFLVPLSLLWLFFFHSCLNVKNRYRMHTIRFFSRLFSVEVLQRHRWFTSTMGLSRLPGCDNISPDCKSDGYSWEKINSHSWDRNISRVWRQEKCCPTLEGETCPFRK